MQEENIIYTWWWNRHFVSLMRGGPGPRAFPTTYYWERKVKWGEDVHFPVWLAPRKTAFYPQRRHLIYKWPQNQSPRTSQAQNTLILRAEIKQHDSFSTIIFTTGPRAFLLFFVEWEPLKRKVICTKFLWTSDCHFMLLWPRFLAKIPWRSGQKQNILWSLNVH